MNIWEIKLLCLSTLHQAPSHAWKHSSKSFTNIQTPLSFTIVIPLRRAVFPHFNFIYVVRMKESLLKSPSVELWDLQPEKKECYLSFLIFDPSCKGKVCFILLNVHKASDCRRPRQLISKGWMLMWNIKETYCTFSRKTMWQTSTGISHTSIDSGFVI